MIQIEKLKLTNDNILVEGIKPEMVRGIYTGISTDDKPQEGKVLAVGPGRILESGTRTTLVIKPKMLVLFNEHTSTKFRLEGKSYYVLREEDVVGFQ